MEVALSRGLVALVDDEDAHLIAGHVWHATSADQARTNYAVSRNGVAMHRILLGAKVGEIIDHIDGDGLNNRRSNLRKCSHAENMRNRKANAKSASRFKGVRRGHAGAWRVTIESNNERIELGQYASEEEAARRYDRAARILHGQFAKTNESLGLLSKAA